jgi:hypothetical protein
VFGISPWLWLFFCVGAVSLCLFLGPLSARAMSRWGVAAAALHPLTTIGLFYSLAVHMHRSLGGWPEVIGEAGFPPALIEHSHLAGSSFGSMLLATIFVVPVALPLCAMAPQLRPAVRYVALYGLLSLVAFGVMQLAPGPFLEWWWD